MAKKLGLNGGKPVRAKLLSYGLMSLGPEKEARVLENIGVDVQCIPLHYRPSCRVRWGFRKGSFPDVERVYARVLTLLLFPRMTVEDAGDVVHALRKVIDAKRTATSDRRAA